MKYTIVFACCLIIGHTQLICAQDIDTSAVCEICITAKHRMPNPYRLSFKHEVPFLVVSTGVLTSGILAQVWNKKGSLNAEDIDRLDREDIFFLDRSSALNNSSQSASYSDFFRSAVTFFPVYFLSNHYTKQDIGPLVVMSVEVFSMTFGLTNIAKNVIRRPRPFTYNPDVPLEDKVKKDAKRSFFSGHTSHTAAFSFFMAKVITDYHPEAKKGLKIFFWSFAATIPAVTAYLRVRAGRHFPTDVIAGYLTGAMVGYFIPHLHLRKNRKSPISFSPLIYDNYTGLSMTIRLGQNR